MASPTTTPTGSSVAAPPAILDGLPLLYEDEEEGDMGETNVHEITSAILRFGLEAHLAGQQDFQVFSNLNLYYHPRDPRAYVSPDLMVVKPLARLPDETSSYRIGEHGPGPVLTLEILSERSAQQRDKTDKVGLYAKLGVAEYLLVDVTGRYLPQRLLMKRLLPNGTWKDEQDADGGATSQIGFRLVLDSDARLRVLNKATSNAYVRPDEAEGRLRELEKAYQSEMEARQAAEATLQRLRQKLGEKPLP
jgi:Uma2 family endonuclease